MREAWSSLDAAQALSFRHWPSGGPTGPHAAPEAPVPTELGVAAAATQRGSAFRCRSVGLPLYKNTRGRSDGGAWTEGRLESGRRAR